MSDNTEKDAKVSGLLSEVADHLKESAPEVYARLRDNMVEREIVNRVTLLDKAFVKRRELTTALSKVNRPDYVAYNADGSVAQSTYTKERLNEISKAQDAVQKLENAMERALTQSDFGKLKDLVK